MAQDTYDAIVVGAGHNGLVTAAYLSQAGVRTLVVERRDGGGGGLATQEVAPGVRAPFVADGRGGLRDSVIRELALVSHGFRAVEPDTAVFAPARDGSPLTLWRDASRTAKELEARGMRDADAFLAFDRKVRTLTRFLARMQEIGRA